MNNLSTGKIKLAFIEIGSIVLGVLIALGASEWNDNRLAQQRVNEALVNISHEVEVNLKLIIYINENNQKVVKAVRESSDEADEADEVSMSFIPGLQIQDTAWRTLIATGLAEHIEYEVLHDISEVYSIQEIYKSIGFQMVQTMFSTTALATALHESGKPELRDDLFIDSMELVVQTETALLSRYQNLDELLRKKGFSDAN
jgi:hypothetical protein